MTFDRWKRLIGKEKSKGTNICNFNKVKKCLNLKNKNLNILFNSEQKNKT